jgi:glycosyltransferase involved in cell wall biosynthesis
MIHDLTPIKFPHFHIKRSTIIHKLLLKKIIKESDLIITASNTTKNDIKNYQQTKAKIEIISLGINQGPRNTVRPPQKVSQPYLLFVGTIEPRKNLTTLLEAFNELKRETKIPHKLILAGQTGWKSENIIALAKSTKNIELKGYVNEEEKNSLYKNADIFIYPSIYEGFGLPPMEAMNNNVPVITSNTSALKELYGNYSLQFKPKDTQALKTHILTLINNPLIRKNLIKKASAYSKNFTWLNTARKTLNAFEKLQ